MADNKKAQKATGASLNEIFIKDQVLSMRGNRVVSRRPRKKGEGKDNSITLKSLWNK